MKTDENKTKQNTIKKKIQCDQSCSQTLWTFGVWRMYVFVDDVFLNVYTANFSPSLRFNSFHPVFFSCYYFFFCIFSFALFWCFWFVCCSYWIDSECVASLNHRSISQNDFISSADKRPSPCNKSCVVAHRVL